MRVVLTQPRDWFEDGAKNFDQIVRLATRSTVKFVESDVVVLPELAGAEMGRGNYLACVRRVASTLGTWVVGGSHHHRRGTRTVNCGVVVNPSGAVVAEYEKLHPYGIEGALGISKGTRVGMFEVHGRKVLILLCADFWFSKSFELGSSLPDLVLVPTFSITQRSSPAPARSLWKHMAISRAYEFAAYVGISDWARTCSYHGHQSSAVAGLADPRPPSSNGFYKGLAARRVAPFSLDFSRLQALRDNRRLRDFLRA